MSQMTDYTEVEIRKGMFRTSTVTVRANSTAYSLGDRIMLGTSDLNVYECTTAGTTAGSPPAFTTTIAGSTTDGTAVFLTCLQGMPKRPVYAALFTAAPSDAGGGTEATGGSYARVAVQPLDANWSGVSATTGLTDNVAAITFPAATASWGTITHMAIMDRLTGGNMLFWGALTTSKAVGSGDTFSFAIAALSITFA